MDDTIIQRSGERETDVINPEFSPTNENPVLSTTNENAVSSRPMKVAGCTLTLRQ